MHNKQKRLVCVGETPPYLLSSSGLLAQEANHPSQGRYFSLHHNTELEEKWRLLHYIGNLEETEKQKCVIKSSRLEGEGC